MRLHAHPACAIGAGLLITLAFPGSVRAQAATAPPPSARAEADSAERHRVELSGTLFTNFQYGGSASSRSANRFELERAYLTARARLNRRASARVTADVFQQRDAARDDFYGGWAFRAKYAYLHYEFVDPASRGGLRASGRIGMLPTVIIDQEETFWPRWISNVALERAGFFSSSDVGAAGTLTLPARLGHLYATVTNGPGYQSRETDRFKDAAARVTFTPLGGSANAMLRSFAITPWFYKGARESRYADGVGSLGPVTEARSRDRFGLLAGMDGRFVTIAAHIAQRRDETDSIAATAGDSIIVVHDVDASVFSAFAIARPFAASPGSPLQALGILLRHDAIEDPELGADRRVLIAGLLWEAGAHLSLALDYQGQTLHDVSATSSPSEIEAVDTRTWFLHAVVNF